MSKWLAALAALVVTTGCNFGNAAQTCTSDLQCQSATKADGRCEPGAGLCSFADTTCDSGRRFGGLAGGQSDQCTSGGSGSGVDAAVDAPADATAIDAVPDAPPDALFCYGTGIVRICLAAAPTTPFETLGGTTTIDTTSSPLCASVVSGGDNYCVIAATTITIAGTLVATGTKPLVLLATQTITATSRIDVASHRGGTESIGAGADPADCAAGTAPVNLAGGAGGSFVGTGGTGGTGAAIGTTTGGVAGTPITALTALRGGCPGQAGVGSAGGAAGHGGGAVFLIAGTSILVQALINAAGEGGEGGRAATSGGGGGGAGGMIGFDAPTITVMNLLLASGGGGGEGSSSFTVGLNGADPSSQTAAPGGDSDTNTTSFVGGAGGSGSVANTDGAGGGGSPGAVGNNGTNRGGGGAGGGGAGVITAPLNAVFSNATSPAVTH